MFIWNAGKLFAPSLFTLKCRVASMPADEAVWLKQRRQTRGLPPPTCLCFCLVFMFLLLFSGFIVVVVVVFGIMPVQAFATFVWQQRLRKRASKAVALALAHYFAHTYIHTELFHTLSVNLRKVIIDRVANFFMSQLHIHTHTHTTHLWIFFLLVSVFVDGIIWKYTTINSFCSVI